MTDFRPAFDREDAEWSVQDYLQVTVGNVEILTSKAKGIVAFERLSGDDDRKLDWDKFARDLSEMTGRTVLNVSDCDWSFDDRHDEEATYVAFDVDGLDRSYLTPERNKLSEAYMASVVPGPAPAP